MRLKVLKSCSKQWLFIVFVVIFITFVYITGPSIEIRVIQVDPVRVLCWVMTHPGNHEEKAVHVKNTWGKRCDKLLFMSSVDDPELPSVNLNVTEGYHHLWGKVKAAFKYVYENHFDETDWFMKADDDSFVVVENLKMMLSGYDSNSAIYLGGLHIRPGDKQVYFGGGSGYILSKEALKRFVEKALPYPDKCRGDGDTHEEEPEIAKCLRRVGVKGIDARDSFGRYKFLQVGLERYLVPGLESRSEGFMKNYYPSPPKEGLECCSETAVGFHYVTPSKMHLFNYLLYEFRSPSEFILEKRTPPVDTVNGSASQSIPEYKLRLSKEMQNLSQKVLCWIVINPNLKENATHVRNTWGKRCDKILFISNASDSGITSNDYLRAALKYIYKKHFTEADWFVKADISTFLVVENLKLRLKGFDPNNPIYFKTGSGYILSKEALLRIHVMDSSTCTQNSTNDLKKIDQTENCLESAGVEIKDLTDRFLQIKQDNSTPSAYPQQADAIGFFNVTSHQLYTFEYLIYHLRPYPFLDLNPPSFIRDKLSPLYHLYSLYSSSSVLKIV